MGIICFCRQLILSEISNQLYKINDKNILNNLAFRHDSCQNSWNINSEEAGPSADTIDLSPSENQSNNQRYYKV